MSSGVENVLSPDAYLPSFDLLLAELIAWQSISSPIESWDQSNFSVICCLESWFKQLGFTTDVIEVPGHSGKYNLIATLGHGERGLVLSGHTDTVPFDQAKWAHDPFKLQYLDERFYGLGTCDKKGFFPIIVEALRAFRGESFAQPLIVLATADEESSMSGARSLSNIRSKLQARAAVIGEPTSIKPIRMHKGIMMEKISITGKSGHSSDPELGKNALEGMHEVISELIDFRQELKLNHRNPMFKVSGPTLNLGHIHGGDSPNRICGHTELSYDIRILPGMDTHSIRQELEKRVRNRIESAGYELEISPLIDYVAPFELAADAELVKISEGLTGQAAASVAFATEAPFLSGLGLDTIVMGAGSIDQAHQPNEYLESSQVNLMADVLASLISKYCLAEGS